MFVARQGREQPLKFHRAIAYDSSQKHSRLLHSASNISSSRAVAPFYDDIPNALDTLGQSSTRLYIDPKYPGEPSVVLFGVSLESIQSLGIEFPLGVPPVLALLLKDIEARGTDVDIYVSVARFRGSLIRI